MRTLLDRLSDYEVSAEGCWLLNNVKVQVEGGVRIKEGEKAYNAHRAAWELLVGPIPDGLVILHCPCSDKCINPEHIRPGTRSMVSMRQVVRGRHPWLKQADGGSASRDHNPAPRPFKPRPTYKRAVPARKKVQWYCRPVQLDLFGDDDRRRNKTERKTKVIHGRPRARKKDFTGQEDIFAPRR